LFAVRRSPAARQSCHCRARGARQRTATRQRVEKAHGKEARTAVRLFPVVIREGLMPAMMALEGVFPIDGIAKEHIFYT
jgi:hypothetical protein